MQDVATWLERHHADGVNLTIKQLLYYQNKSNLLDLSPSKTIQAKLAGSYLAKTKGRGMEFDEARHYQPGDDIRAIDWRVTARTGKTYTKIYREEKERPVFILADLSSSMYFGTQFLFKSVQAAHLAALIAWAARERGDRIGGLIFNQQSHLEFKPMTRQKAVLSLLHGLMQLHLPPEIQGHSDQQEHGIRFTDACARLRRLAHPGSLIYLLSDFQQMTEAAKQHISRLSRHCEVVAYPISDPFEHELPKVNIAQSVSISDGQNKQVLTLGEKNTAERYSEQHQQQFARIEQILKQCKAQVIPVSCAMSLEDQLVSPLSRRRR